MLTGYQVETIAYMTDGAIICRTCAESDYSTLTLDKIDRGLPSVADDVISPLSRYSIDEYLSESASECADQDFDYDSDPVGWQSCYDLAAEYYPCDNCGADIS